nr:peptidylprolyl isomerase [uncultured Stomatobaculum sp.]
MRERTNRFRKRGEKFVTLLLVIFCCLLFAACGREKKEENVAGTALPYRENQLLMIIASARKETEAVYGSEIWEKRVSGGTKTFSEAYFDELRQFFYELSALNGMAEERNVKLDTEETRRLHDAAQRFYTESVQGQSAFGSLSEEEVEFMFQQYARALKLRKVMREDRKAEVSESEAKVIHLQSAACESRDNAEKLREEALAGNDFRTLARKYGGGDAPAKKVARGELAPELERVAFAMEDNTVSAVTELDGKYYVFKCTESYDKEETAKRRKKLQDERLQNLVREAYERYLAAHPFAENEGLWDSVEATVGKSYSGGNFFTAVREALRYEGV